MPATTRSATKQAKLEDVNVKSESKKRKAPPSNSSKGKVSRKPPQKKQKKGGPIEPQPSVADLENDAEENRDIITINRAPVLELWASCVAHFLHPEVSWETCLSVGGAISTITAIAKGRSIGTMEKPDPGEAAERRQKRREKAEKEQLDELEVMHFKLRIRDGHAMVGDAPKKGNEVALRRKYGDDAYERAKITMQEALSHWKGKEEELDQEAFQMYENFRPSIPPGQKGWGRRGQLHLQNVTDAISAR